MVIRMFHRQIDAILIGAETVQSVIGVWFYTKRLQFKINKDNIIKELFQISNKFIQNMLYFLF